MSAAHDKDVLLLIEGKQWKVLQLPARRRWNRATRSRHPVTSTEAMPLDAGDWRHFVGLAEGAA